MGSAMVRCVKGEGAGLRLKTVATRGCVWGVVLEGLGGPWRRIWEVLEDCTIRVISAHLRGLDAQGDKIVEVARLEQSRMIARSVYGGRKN